MFKWNEKGFALVETLIVSVFVVTIFTILYTNFLPMMGEYERRENYDDIDSIYMTYLIKSMLEASEFKNGKVDVYNNLIEATKSSKEFSSLLFKADYEVLEDGTVSLNHDSKYCENLTSTRLNYCNSLFSEIKATRVYLTGYDITDLKRAIKNGSISDEYMDQATKDYILTLPYYKKTYGYKTRVIVEYIKEVNKESTNYRKNIYKFSTIGVELVE